MVRKLPLLHAENRAGATAMDQKADRRLSRSADNRRLLGVCGGLGEYFGIDPVLWRLAFVLLLVFGGIGAYLYVGLAFLMAPPQRAVRQADGGVATPLADLRQAALTAWPGLPISPSEKRARRRRRVGRVLVLVGAFFLAANLNLLVWLQWELIWPLLLAILGVVLLLRRP